MANGPILAGQLLEGKFKQPIQFTEQSMDKASADALLGTEFVEITPRDQDNSLVKTYTANESAFTGLFKTYDTYMPLQGIPDVLNSFSITWEKGGGSSDSLETVTGAAAGSYSLSMSAAAPAQASAFCVAKPVIDMTRYDTSNLRVTHCFFYLAAPTEANALTRLGTELGVAVNAWPVFKLKSHTITAVGMKVSANARRSISHSISANDNGSSYVKSEGVAKGYDHAPSVDIIQIPPCLHGPISLSDGDYIEKVATGTTIITAGFLSGGGNAVATAYASGTVAPTTLLPTVPESVPTTGKYLYKLDVEPSEDYGYTFVHAIVFDFANLYG